MKGQVKIKIKRHEQDFVEFKYGFNWGRKMLLHSLSRELLVTFISPSMFSVAMIINFLQISVSFLKISVVNFLENYNHILFVCRKCVADDGLL